MDVGGSENSIGGVHGVVGDGVRSGLSGEESVESAADKMDAVGLYPRSFASRIDRDDEPKGEPCGRVTLLRSLVAVASRDRRAKDGDASWKM